VHARLACCCCCCSGGGWLPLPIHLLIKTTAKLSLCKSTSAKRQSTNSKPQTPNPKTPNPKPQTPNLKPQTSNPKPEVLQVGHGVDGAAVRLTVAQHLHKRVGGWGLGVGAVTRATSHLTRHTSHVTRHTSHVTRHTSHVTRHTPHATLTLLVMSMASLPVIAAACSCAPCSQSVRRRCAAGEGAGMRCACGVASVWFVV